MEEIKFYGTRKQYGCFSNFSKHDFYLDGQHWCTSEHYFQAQKFVGTKFYDEVQQASSPRKAATIGRNRSLPLRKDWETVKVDVMRKALRAKFTSNQKIKEVLLSTNNAKLVENSPTDYYWGCGANGKGRNVLGILLEEIRDELRKNKN